MTIAKVREIVAWCENELKEINTSNYNHDDVCDLNTASVSASIGLREALTLLTALEQRGEKKMKTFTAYRPLVHTHGKHDENQANAPDQPQFEGVVFSDGKVAQRWLTAKGSVAVWDCLQDMIAIHGHPEYGTYIVWHDGNPMEVDKG